MSVYGLNQEGYPDPTAATVVANVSKAEKKYLPLVYICSKYSGDTVTNTEAAKRYSRFAVEQGAIPLAPHLLLPLYMHEDSERELAKAKKHRKKIRYFDSACKETNQALDIGPERMQEDC